MIMIKVKSQLEISNQLDRIEGLLLHIFKREEDLSENDVLEMLKEGDDEYRRGETIEFDELIRTEFPHLVKK
ncbi:MAG: hypothetical protein UT11_C0030G0011 [Berkelbacteria bacterium GW2011_GWA2_38_9]|uniref:Uncharacterized protein n=1 Tax=Berkelbacteria bacterium GW2011_GWA2_38_9 TaxID=1618334 RepID=A0A0G0PIW7_9BACT|nr:MAG: hypothetical protein UT11_C0030G0011 [Berkelbacteria bacterium GW2011_GWA2_38_9]